MESDLEKWSKADIVLGVHFSKVLFYCPEQFLSNVKVFLKAQISKIHVSTLAY